MFGQKAQGGGRQPVEQRQVVAPTQRGGNGIGEVALNGGVPRQGFVEPQAVVSQIEDAQPGGQQGDGRPPDKKRSVGVPAVSSGH